MRRPVIAGMAAATLMAWFLRPRFGPQSLSSIDVLIASAMYVAAIFLVSAVTAHVSGRFRDLRNGALRIAVALAWIAPLFLLVLDKSLWAAAASTGLAVSITGLWDSADVGEHAGRRFATSLGASVCLQAALVAAIADYPRITAMMAAVSAAILVSIRPERLASRFTIPRAAPRIALAIILTAFSLARFLRVQRISGGSDALFQALLAGQAAVGAGEKNGGKKEQPAQIVGGGEFTGVILYPESTPHTMLVPPLPSLNRGLKLGNKSEPLSIPFFGVYWFYRPPFRRPPPGSSSIRGSTIKTVFRAVDNTRLYMEARQNFGVLIDVSCCKRIDLAIRNADLTPEMVWLELSLVNTTLVGEPTLSLGKAGITADVEQTLSFAVPPSPALQKFDAAAIRFQRSRSERSAKIAIDRFVLAP